jgi:hypothetical protein
MSRKYESTTLLELRNWKIEDFIPTAQFLLRNWNFVVKIVEDIRKAFA